MLLGLALFIYARGYARLRKASSNSIKISRAAAYVGGLSVVWIAAGSSLAALDHQLLLAHMIQHILLMAVAVPLLYLGDTVRVFSNALSSGLVAERVDRPLHWAPPRWVGRIASRPIFCWCAATITVLGWHVPALFELAMHHPWWHGIQMASFFVAGLFFWWPVIQPWPSVRESPSWSIPLYLFLATLPCDMLSAFLTFSGKALYNSYRLAPHASWRLSPLQDQEWAGVIMWVAVTFLYLIPAAVVTVEILSPPKGSFEVHTVSAGTRTARA